MSLGTIHSNLYKPNAKEVKAPITVENNLNVSDRKFMLFFISFLFVSFILVSSALASHSLLISVSDGSDRINKTGASVIWRFNITSSSGAVQNVNITNATTGTSGYRITNVNATGNATDACTIFQNSFNCTGVAITSGTSRVINVTATGPTAGQSGRGNWTVHTFDGTDVQTEYVFTLTLDNTDIGFDLSDQMGNITRNATVQVANGTNSLLTFNGGANIQTDANDDGLIIIESSSLDPGGDDTFAFNVSRDGFVNVTNFNTTVVFTTSGTNNGYKPTGQQFGIRITVEDQLGNALTGATVNVTATNGTAAAVCATCTNTTSTPNATLGNTFFFALSNTSFSNVTFRITRSGFLNNGTLIVDNITSGATFFLANTTFQQNGSSPYQMRFVLRVNATDELGSANSTRAGLTLAMNTSGVGVNTDVTANRTDPTDANVYYFSISETAFTVMNVTASKSGYVNESVVAPINASTQASINPQMRFRLRLVIQDELSGAAGFTEGVTIRLNGTTTTANATSSNSYYFNTSESAVNISVSRTGYINETRNETLLNGTSQSNLTMSMRFSIRVIGICSELGSGGQCFTIDGTDSAVEVSGNGNRNSTYSSNNSYINATNGPSATTITLNASNDGYVNRSITIITNDTSQAVVMFNTTGGTGTTDSTTGLLFTVRVLGVFDELGRRNFTLDGTTAAVDVGSGQINNVFYLSNRAYANATGTSAVDIIAYMVNQSYINETQSATPTASNQQTILYNRTNQTTNEVNITDKGLSFTIRINVQDERGNTTNMDSGVTISLNNTSYTADDQSGASYFFTNRTGPVPGAVNVTVPRSGYVNVSSGGDFPAGHPINQSTQANLTISLPFTARYAAVDELGTNLTASDVTFTVNGTAATANFTDSVYAYFAYAPGGIYVNASRAGYVDNNTIYIDPINASTQTATRNITMNFTVLVVAIYDELNVTSLTIDGSTAVVNSGGAEISANGVAGRGATNSTRYSGGRAYINATNGTNINITAFGDGFINRTVTGVTPNAANRTVVSFMVTANYTPAHVNGSALLYSLRVLEPCDQLNFTCQTLTGSITTAKQAAADINGTSMTGGNITRYNSGRAYISAGGTGPGRTAAAFTINASSVGFINATNSSVTPSQTAQTDVIFNTTTTALNYSVRMTLQDELSQTANMNTSTIIFTNNSNLVENVSYFRTSPTSNLYYINATNPGSVNVTASRAGYINTTFGGATGTAVNQTVQATPTIQLPFSVRIETKSVDINSGTTERFTGTTVQLIDSGGNIYTTRDGNGTLITLYNNSVAVTNSTGGQGDGNSSNDGFIYWALSQSNVTGSSEVVVYPNRNGYNIWRITGRVLSYTAQAVVTSGNPTDATPPSAATGASATVSGKQTSVTWTGSTSGNVGSYRIYRNDTLVDTVPANATTFVDSPTLGDTTTPGAPSGVTASASGTQVSVTWTAPASFNYIYRITTVSTGGTLATSNASTGGVTVSPISYYSVFRNSTLLGSSSTTSFTDAPGTVGVYVYNVSTITDANVSSTSNGTSGGVDTRDTTAPAAVTAVVANVSGKQVSISWTRSTSSDVSYHRVFRNNTFIGTATNSTVFTDSPTLGDLTSPAAPTSVTATTSNGTILVSWTGATNSTFTYYVTAVDTTGNEATSNGTSNSPSISPVGHYRVYRNTTQLIGTSSTTSFVDAPTAGVYYYNVTTVSDASILSTSNGSTSTLDTRDTTAPTAATSPAGTVNGKQVVVSWVASSSSDASYYRIYKNNTLLGTSSSTSSTDTPTLGDTTTPGAPSSVSATKIGTEVQVSWTAPEYFAYGYHINTVDTAGNAATSNVTANVTVNQVARYLVYRNSTLLGTSDTTSFKENPGDPGVYTYSVMTVTDANVSSSSNGTSTVDTRDSTTPAAATSVTGTVLSSKQVSLSWTASTANDTSYYRVYRNNTFIGTSSNTTGFIDTPTTGDVTAPGAPSGVASSQTNGVVTVSWTAPSNVTFVYAVTTVDTAGNLATSNGTTSGISVNSVASYRIFRNNTFIGTSTSTAFSDTPSGGVYAYNVQTASDAGVLSTSNGTATALDTRDTTAPAAASSLSATISGKEVRLSWTASTSGDVTHYRVYRNDTLIGTAYNTTAFVDTPTFGDTSAPGAASSVTATVTANNATHREVTVTWTAPSNFAFNYSVAAVDSSSNLAAANATLTSGAASISPVGSYRVHRNDTLLGTSTATAFVDTPSAGIFVYRITTVSDAVVLSSSNGTSGGATLGEFVAPAIIITAPALNANVTTTTPTITFMVIDNDGGIGVDIASIAVNTGGFNATRDCTRTNDLNYTCSYASNALTDLVNTTLQVAAKDKFGNAATNASRNFGVNSQAGVTATLNATDTSAIADNTYANGWSFTFNITLGSTTSNATTVNATAVKIANWTQVGGSATIPTANNTVMNYTDASGTRRIYYASDDYNSTDTIYPLQDLDTTTRAINGTVTIFMKIPAATVPGTYSTTFTFGSWSVAMTGGNPT